MAWRLMSPASQRVFCLPLAQEGVGSRVRFFPEVVLVVFLLVGFPSAIDGAIAKGWTEIEIQWLDDQESQQGSTLMVSQSLSWQGEPSVLPLSTSLQLKVGRVDDNGFLLEKGELVAKSIGYELRGFSNMGFRSTLDPMRLLSSSRRADPSGGFELRGEVGPVAARGLWVNQIANTGDDGPLLLLDMTLLPKGVGGKYRYLHLAHDSDWNWHHPQSGSYATRTARQIHSLVGSWNIGPTLRFSSQLTALTGFDVKKTYRRDLAGLAVLTRGEGALGDVRWSVDIYHTNPGFMLATGDANSLKPGRQGVGLGITQARHRDESLHIKMQHDEAVPELNALPIDTPGYTTDREPHSSGEMTYRRRWGDFNCRLGIKYETGEDVENPGVFWETSWLPKRVLVGGRYGGSGSPQVYGKVSLHPQLSVAARWDPSKAWWRTALQMQSPAPQPRAPARWIGEAVYKKRPAENYTYLSLQHKMEQGYWEISWGKSDQGRLDWAWGRSPQLSIRLGRYF